MRIAVVLLTQVLALSMVKAGVPDAQPPLVRFSPTIDVYPQNFSIAVDNSDQVFLGNADGVVIFDGESWQLTTLTNNEIARSLEFDGKSRVYVGGFDGFGFIEKDAFGRFVYTDLAQRFAGDLNDELFADIWHVEVSELGVFFVGLEHLFLFQPESGETGFWKHKGSFGPIASYKDRVWLQWRGEGIKSFDGEHWQPALQPSIQLPLARDFLTALVPVGEDLIVVNSENDWDRFDGETFTSMAAGTATIPFNASAAHGFVAGEQKIDLTTQLGHVVFHDLMTGKSEIIKVSPGFVPAAAKTSDGHLLLTDDLGFIAMKWPARWRVIGPETGLAGSVNAIKFRDGNMYVMTSSGSFVMEKGADAYRRLPWTDYEAWDLLDTGREFLLADSYEIKMVSFDGSVKSIDDNTTARLFVPSSYHDGIVFVGTEYGLQVLKREGDGWRVVKTLDDMTNLTVMQIVEMSPNEIFLGSMRGGIYQLRFDELDGEFVSNRISSEMGLSYGDPGQGAYIYSIGGRLIATTAAGIFSHDGERFQADSLFGLDNWQVPGETIELAVHGEDLWAFHYDRLFRFDGAWHEEDVSGLVAGALMVLESSNGDLLIGALGSILTFDQEVPASNGSPSGISMTRATMTVADGNSETRSLPIDDIQLSTFNERLTLQFARIDFTRPQQVRFRSRLRPIEINFSDWAESGQQSFVDLNPGTYTLHVEAINSLGEISRVEVPVTVHPQWFETRLFQALVILLTIALMFIGLQYIANRQSRRLEWEKDLLEEKVTERTRALQFANQQLDRMAHLDGLTKIPNRRKLDSYLEDVRLQCAERSRVMAIALLDVDHFKNYNDSRGHQAGDQLLVELAKLLSRNLRRAEDLVARYGGEEFLVVLPGADPRTAYEVVEGMRRHVESSQLEVNVSLGLHVHTPDDNTSIEDMIARADAALYDAKNSGRNRIAIG